MPSRSKSCYFLQRTESMRATALQSVAMTGLAGAYDEEPNGARQS
jgi:hypothetical protein